MFSALSYTVNFIDRWTMHITKGMPAIATLVGVVLLSESIYKKSDDSKRVVGIIGLSIGAITLYSPRIGRLVSAVSLISTAVLMAKNKP